MIPVITYFCPPQGLYFGRDVPKTDPEASQPLTGPNQWPSEVRETFLAYKFLIVSISAALLTYNSANVLMRCNVKLGTIALVIFCDTAQS